MPEERLSRQAVLERFDALNVWQRRGQRAPHKPLLVLYALGRLSRGDGEPVRYAEVDEAVAALLKEFGPSRQSYHPEYPFWRLQRDGVWKVDAPEAIRFRVGSTDVPKSELLRHDVRGGFSGPVRIAFQADARLVENVASRILEAHFPTSVHGDILEAVGLQLGAAASRRRPRDPRFRVRVLTAYGYRCAVCGLDLRLGTNVIALDAAHIQWHQAGGPDVEANGFALCVLHHKVFDLGAFTVQPDRRLLVSEQLHGSSGVDDHLMRYHGAPVQPPQRREQHPRPEYLAWHRQQVFRGRPRDVA